MSEFVVRLDRRVVEQLRELISRHPLRPTLRATIERAIVLMIEDLQEEMRNDR